MSFSIFGVVKSWRLSSVAIFAREKNYFAIFKKTKVVNNDIIRFYQRR